MRAALRTSSNRAAVRMLRGRRHPGHRAVRRTARPRRRAERAVAGARLGRSDAAVADVGVSARSPTTGAGPAPSLIRRVEDADGEVLYRGARRRPQRGESASDGVPDDVDAGGRHQRRHGVAGAAARVSRCRRRARRARPTTTATPGSSATRRRSSPACGSATTSRGRSCAAAMPARSPCRSGRAS